MTIGFVGTEGRESAWEGIKGRKVERKRRPVVEAVGVTSHRQ